MTQSDDEEIKLIELGPSGPRLWLGVGCAAGLGIILFWIVFAGRPAMAYQVSFLVIGALSLFLADRIRRSGHHSIILTNKVLKTETGQVLTTIDNVRAVERGAFTLKPPNGFLVRLHELIPGRYEFFGEFSPNTARGAVIVTEKERSNANN